MAKKQTKRSKKKTPKKQNIFVKVLFAIIILLIIGAGVYGYVVYNPLVQEKIEEINEVEDYFLNDFFKEKNITTDISFPKTIEGYEDIAISFSSGNATVIADSGKVTFPTYSDGDKIVEITINYKVISNDSLFGFAWDILGKTKETKIKLTVKCLEASAKEKINIIESGIFVPEYTSCNIGLLQKDNIFSSVDIIWETSDNNIITATGEKRGLGEAKLKATLKCDDLEKTLEYSIVVGDELPQIIAMDISFDNYSKRSYAEEYEKDGIKYINAIFKEDETSLDTDSDSLSENVDKVVRFKATSSSSAYFMTTTPITSPKEISFVYRLPNSDSSKVNKNSYLKVYYSVDNGEVWNLLSEDKIVSETVTYKKSLDDLQNVTFKVEFTTEYSELTLDIDEFKITRLVNEEDIEESLKKAFQTKFTSSRVLPLTTIYGGVINWTSMNQESLTNSGIVTRLNETKNVLLKAEILGFASKIEINFDTIIPGRASVLPVEVYFIDLGKYGLSDCGESIYIKYGSIDILIDAGDEIKTSHKAIKEIIDNYSEDKIFEYLIATHPDSDHIGGMPFIFENYEIQNVIQFSGEHTSNLYKKYVNAYESEGCLSICTALDSYNNDNGCKRIIQLGNDVYIEIINTNNYQGKETNTRSVVCVLNAYGVRTLLTGDADNGSNSNLENDYKDSVGNIDILKAVHHGTSNGTTIPFLQAVDPEVVIICNGNYLGNKHGHPTPNAINRIYEYDSNITIYTITGGDSSECKETSSGSYKCDVNDGMVDRNGTIKLTIDETGYSINSEYYGDNPLELSSTNYWKTNPMRKYSYQGK